MIRFGWVSIFALLLPGCSSKPVADRQTAAEKGPPATSIQNEQVLKIQAETFDSFLKQKLSTEEFTELQNSCNHAPQKNVFCFSVINESYFRKKASNERSSRSKSRRRRKRVYPRFKKQKVRNWKQLRYANINATITSVASVSKNRLRILKNKALKETKCPNNVAISVASALEDILPENSSKKEIGALYRIGARCLSSRPADQRTLLTRGGLFFYAAKELPEALKTFTEATETKNAFISRPLYWKYRTEIELEKKDHAEKTLAALREKYPFSFHTLVAQMAQSEDPGDSVLKTAVNESLKRSLQLPAVNLLIEQVEVLHHFGFDDSANEVLNWAITESKEAEPSLKIYLAALRKGDGDHFSKISLLSNVLYDNPQLISRKTMELYFPRPYFPIFQENSQGIDPHLLMAIARQESAFNPRAVSSAKAMGLLQVLPKTGRRISKTKGKKLMDPKTNVQVGSVYFHELLNQLQGQVHLALAAYNAGPRRVSEWTRRYQTEEPILFVDLIPYRETRDYVALILRNYYWYRRLNATSDNEYPSSIIDVKGKVPASVDKK